jgi:hypothetical protein
MAYGVKICIGCGDRGRWGGSGRCPSCYALHKAKYREPEFVADRQHWRDLLTLGVLLDCARCGEQIRSIDDLDCDHATGNSPTHARCNRGRIGGGFAS